jgi:hypothetical protein
MAALIQDISMKLGVKEESQLLDALVERPDPKVV